MTTANSFGARAPLKTVGGTFEIFRLDALEKRGLAVARLPYSLRILLENLLRREDGRTVAPAEIERLARWDPKKTPDDEIAFMPARVLMQDFTGVPAVVDLAAMRDAMQQMGGDPKQVNPLLPAELVLNVGSASGFAMVFALLVAAILWNLATWWRGLPASSSHTMIGSIIGLVYIKVTKQDASSYELPFGTFLAFAAILVAVAGGPFMDWYAKSM